MRTVLDQVNVLLQFYGDTHLADHWDGYAYEVTGPISLDDPAVLTVELKNANGTTVLIKLPITATGGAIHE